MGIRNILVALAALMLALPTAVQAQDEMFKGKTMKLYVGYGPGGGYDLYTRVLARHMMKYLPGKPNYVVENMPGAGSALLANHLYNRGAKDGTEFGIINSTIAFDPLFGGEAAEAIKFDPSTLTWIGSLDQFSDSTDLLEEGRLRPALRRLYD